MAQTRLSANAELASQQAQKRWLRGHRKLLEWSVDETARRLHCSILEYMAFESGKVVDIDGLTFEEIKEFMEWHLEAQVIGDT